MYIGIRLLLICPFISSFFFLSNFHTLNLFITLFSRTVRPRRLKLGTHLDMWADVLCIPESGCCCLLVPLFLYFLSLQFSNIENFRTLLSGTVRPRKVETWYTGGQWVDVWHIPESGCCCLFVSLFFVSNMQILKFSSHFSQEL